MNINDYELFKENKDTLKELSKDDSKKDENKIKITEYLVKLEDLATNFDKVKKFYANSYSTTEDVLSSVDALMSFKEDILFIEFKNGKISNNMLNNDIKKKIYSTILIFSEITKMDFNYIRENTNFILVYNEEKNKEKLKNSKKDIHNSLLKKANQEIIHFGLEKYKKVFFKNVYTYSAREFEQFIIKNIK